MTVYALIEDSLVKELFETDKDIRSLFHPDFMWIKVDSSVKEGQQFVDGVFSDIVKVVPVLSKDAVESLRLTAYANPITGSDRYFSESLALQAEGFATTSIEVKEAKAKGLARKLEIQTLYPYPAE